VTLFVVSDIHGHYTVLKDALDVAGFDETNPEHHLLALGDYFDRGKENAAVYEYIHRLMTLGKADGLLGNHDLFLLEFLEGDDEKTVFNAHFNGTDVTLEDFSGMRYDQANHDAIRRAIMSRYPELYSWLKQLPLYIEHEDYVFTHGGLDGSDPDWRSTPRETFVWNYQSGLPGLKGKTIVVGHERTPQVRMKRGVSGLTLDDPAMSAPYYEDGVIYIDPFVEQTKRMNVLTLTLQSF